MQEKPLILVTNDDGITSAGIRSLVEVARAFGEVVVVAPNSPQSAKGHGITIIETLHLYKSSIFEGIESYECSGTPVDCVKLAKQVVLKNRKITLCVSGINHGSNASANIIYSGTMAAAMEASLEGVKSIGFSLCDHSYQPDFSVAKVFVEKMIRFALESEMSTHRLLNVNIPRLPLEAIKGIKVCRQANARWTEEFLENKDPYGKPYYWLTGKFINEDISEDTDEWALANGYVSVVPCTHDFTAYKSIGYYEDELKNIL